VPGSTAPVFKLAPGPVNNCRYENFTVNAQSFAFTATGSGTNLTVSGVTGIILVGSLIYGTGIPVDTTIVSQTSGTTGGAGVYVTSLATTASAAACTGTPNQDCFNLQAANAGGGNGGLWWSKFSNININNFGGKSFWFRGDTTGTFQFPHQFIDFEGVKVLTRAAGTTARCILATGQCGQFTFDGECQLEGVAGSKTGYNVELGPEFNNAGVVGGSLVGGSAVGSQTPYNFKFKGTTLQNAKTGVYAYNSINIIVDACYVENMIQPFVAVATTSNFRVLNCHFTNATADGTGIAGSPGTGSALSLGGNCRGALIGCDIISAVDRVTNNASGHWGLEEHSNIVLNTPFGPSLNHSLSCSIASNAINVQGASDAYISQAGTINTITSLLTTGEEICLIVNNGAAGNVVFGTSGNVVLGSKSTLTCGDHDTIVLKKLDGAGDKFALLSSTGILT
jgi:hypothetical protein